MNNKKIVFFFSFLEIFIFNGFNVYCISLNQSCLGEIKKKIPIYLPGFFNYFFVWTCYPDQTICFLGLKQTSQTRKMGKEGTSVYEISAVNNHYNRLDHGLRERL